VTLLETRARIDVEARLDHPEIATNAVGTEREVAIVSVRHLLPPDRDDTLAA